MKHLILAATAAGLLAACGETAGEGAGFGSIESGIYYCPADVRTNWGGQTIDTGDISVSNDEDDLIITITGMGGWMVDEWHVYAGTGPVPLNGGGNPSPGRFPYQDDLDSPQSEVVVTIPLASLGVGCDDGLNVAVHSVMRNQSGGSSEEETAWADWTDEFGGSRWGGSFTYSICCETENPNPPTCLARMPHYWAQMPNEWPASVQSMNLGSTSYTKDELLALLALDWTVEGNDISIFLAHHVIGARLNIANGSVPPASILTRLDEADAWFDANADLDGRLPYGVHKDAAAGQAAKTIKDPIMVFNEACY